jgi:hypothetical protein
MPACCYGPLEATVVQFHALRAYPAIATRYFMLLPRHRGGDGPIWTAQRRNTTSFPQITFGLDCPRKRVFTPFAGDIVCSNIEKTRFYPGAIANDQASIEADLRDPTATFFHPSGTCRWASSPALSLTYNCCASTASRTCVVDPSIMQALNACTQALTIMIGEKGAALIVEDA